MAGSWWTGAEAGEMPCKVSGDAHHVDAEVVELAAGPHWENRCTLCRQVWWTPAHLDGQFADRHEPQLGGGSVGT